MGARSDPPRRSSTGALSPPTGSTPATASSSSSTRATRPTARSWSTPWAEAGHEPAEVGHILLTHGHPDHTAAIDVFPDAVVYAHANDTNLVGADRLDEPVADGDALTIGTRDVRVFHLPGHTAGSVAYLVDSTLFMGDAASATRTGGMQNTPWVLQRGHGPGGSVARRAVGAPDRGGLRRDRDRLRPLGQDRWPRTPGRSCRSAAVRVLNAAESWGTASMPGIPVSWQNHS